MRERRRPTERHTQDNKDHGRRSLRPVTRRERDSELGEEREEERWGSGVGRIREGRLGNQTEG
jgi:hypothetical protein